MKKIFNTADNSELFQAKEKFKYLCENHKIIKVELCKKERTNDQNKARWLYLSMVSDILNEQGLTLTVPGTESTEYEIQAKFTKDNLYAIYWQTMRGTLYPNKKEQLNTKEFANLVDHVMIMFAQIFEITITFPNWKTLTQKEN